MKIYLLTHAREINRETNTGSIAIKSTEGLVERIIWDRVNPDKQLVELIESNATILLYPNPEAKPLSKATFENIIIIDATWQEARKIYNKSPYLKAIKKATLTIQNTSQYNLRRNQPQGGLCTIECIIEILKIKEQTDLIKKLTEEFESFNNPIII